MKICAVIITYNRSDNLKKLLSALTCQTYKDFDTVIFDASANGDAAEAVKAFSGASIRYERLSGTSVYGAFESALGAVYGRYDWLWLLHDDTVPERNALLALVNGISCTKRASFFASAAFTEKNIPAYVPPLSPFKSEGKAMWGEKLEHSLIRIAGASSASILLNTQAIKQCGLPAEGMSFKDSSGYLGKLISEYGAAYLVGKSKVIHPMPEKFLPVKPAAGPKICAVVVTYNRKEMLLQCLNALKAQKYSDFDVLIVDNASTDGTAEFIKPHLTDGIYYVNTGGNRGGSGGFYYGMKCAYERGYDWLWIMDDDVVATPTALGELVEHLRYVKTASFLASAVYAADKTALNTPEISRYTTNGYRFWYDKLEYGMMRLAHATFVSLLINRKAIEKCGLPCKDYFIWGDDTEYTMRIIARYGAAYMVGSSKVYHLRDSSSALNIRTETNENRIPMYYYLIRNTLLNSMAYSGKKACRSWLKRYFKDCVKIALGHGPCRKLKIKTILSAMRDFIRGRYAAEAFNNRYNLYGQENAVISFIGLEKAADALKGQYGYTVASLSRKPSLFTVFGYAPAYIKEYEYSGTDCVTEGELRRSAERDIRPLTGGQYLVADFYGSHNPVGVLIGENDSFTVNYTDEFASDFNGGRLEVLSKNYSLRTEDVTKYDSRRIEEYVTSFVLKVSRMYSQDRVVVVKYAPAGGQSATDEAEKFADMLADAVCRRMPQCKVLTITSAQSAQSVCAQLLALVSR